MNNTKYDFIVIGRWRNHEKVNKVRDVLRAAGKTVYCFTDNAYDGDDIKIETHKDVNADAMMQQLESVEDWRSNPTFRKIFETDMQGLRDAQALVLVFPAGLSAHMELGAAYGMGKPCYAVGEPEKNETLYLMFDKMFADVEAMRAGLL
jgi:hypothetical protein